jgi:hypothetical protein
MGGTDRERREEAERLREFFEVQLLFAEIYASRTSGALSDVCLRFTNLHWRLGLGTANNGAASPEWRSYAEELERCVSMADRLERTIAFFMDAARGEDAAQRFGCFRFDAPDSDGLVRIHFRNRDTTDDCGPLARSKVERRISELREMFEFIRAHHPDARDVRGCSWLYNIPAYRRLFPPEYAASTFEPPQVRLNGTSSWGQVLDFRGRVKPAIGQRLLENIRHVAIGAPWKAFPLRALGAQGDIEHFYRFYGC